MRVPSRLIASICLITAVATGAAHAQQTPQLPYEVDPVVDGAITTAGFGATLLWGLVDVQPRSWSRQLFPWDERVKDNFSASAAALADGTVLLAATLPLALHLRAPFDESAGRRALLYGEAMALNLFFMNSAKYLVQRPRPYTYNTNPLVRRYAVTQGDDAYLSFYSGHSSTSFTAAIAGSYLYALESDDLDSRATVWGLQLALAAFTANLRVRAGKHFYSDIAIGAVAGIAIGLSVPLLHQREAISYRPSGREWAAMSAGLVTGALLSELLPLPRDLTLPLDAGSTPVAVIPLVLQGGGTGIALLAHTR